MASNSDLTTGRPSLALFRLAGPMIFGLAAVLSQSLVDTFFVGKLGTEQLAALSFTFPVSLTFTSLAIGLSAGASSVVSRVIGTGSNQEARDLATDGLILSAMIVTAISVLGWLTIEPLFRALGATDSTMPYILRYMPIWYCSMPFLVVGIVGHGAMRANGEGNWPSFLMVGSALVNVVLTPVLMYGSFGFPQLDIEGVAIATLVSRVLNFVVTLAVLYGLMKLIVFRLPTFDQFKTSAQRLLKVALPAGAGNVVNPVGIGVVTALLAGFGEETVAAFGVATRLESFACLPMLALSSAIGPFAGQNWGADKQQRIIDGLKVSYAACFATSILLIALFWFSGEPLAGFFASEQAVSDEALQYLHIVSFSLWGYGLVIVTASCFNGMGRAVTGFSYYAVRMLVLYVPLSWLAVAFFDQRGVYIAIALSNGVAGLVCAATALWWLKKHKAPL